MSKTKIRIKKIFNSSGFTLIELLIVIALIGVLTTVILVYIDPFEQFAKARDAGKKSTVAQLGGAASRYRVSRRGTYPTVNNTWITTLVDSGELKNAPLDALGAEVSCTVPDGNPIVTAGLQNGYCYKTNGTEVIVYTKFESKSEKSKCDQSNAFYVWSSVSNGESDVFCSPTEPNF